MVLRGKTEGLDEIRNVTGAHRDYSEAVHDGVVDGLGAKRLPILATWARGSSLKWSRRQGPRPSRWAWSGPWWHRCQAALGASVLTGVRAGSASWPL